MNISDEWETPEKQPFKDFVSVLFMLKQSAIKLCSPIKFKRDRDCFVSVLQYNSEICIQMEQSVILKWLNLH